MVMLELYRSTNVVEKTTLEKAFTAVFGENRPIYSNKQGSLERGAELVR